MKKLLSLPPNLVECFHDIEKADRGEWFCTSDPIGSKLGSGGGTAWLLEAFKQHVAPDKDFMEWLALSLIIWLSRIRSLMDASSSMYSF